MSDVKVSLTVALQGRTMLSQETADALEIIKSSRWL